MLAALTRLIGRLPVGRKLLLIYLLDLTAVIYISGILINEKYLSIDFSRKEVAGNAYIAAVRDVVAQLPAPLPGAPAQADRAALQRAAEVLAARAAEHDTAMHSGEVSATLQRALAALAASPEPSAAQRDAVFTAARTLITRVGNQSNLILDPDLDSYYTMSLVLLRYAELHEVVVLAARQAVALRASDLAGRTARQTEMLLLEGRLSAVARGAAADLAEATAAGRPDLAAALRPAHERLEGALAAFLHAAQGRDADTAAPAALAVAQREALAAVDHAWRTSAGQLDVLLDRRIDALFERMWKHLGAAVAVLVCILGMVYLVARQISRPIRRLADVAEKVSRSGDFTLRAPPGGGDEIGQLVTAFNQMLGDLDRDRAMREELAVARRAAEVQRALVESFPSPLIVTSIPEHHVLHANSAAADWLGPLNADPWRHCLEPAARARFFQQLSDVGTVDGFEVLWRPAGQAAPQWALLSARRLSFQGVPALLTAFTPVGRMKLLEQRLQLWAKVFEASSESILVLDVDRRILAGNQAFSRASGWEPADAIGQTPDFLYSDRHDAAFYETIWQSAIIRGNWQGEVWLNRKSGEAYPTWLVANAVRSTDGRITHVVAAAVDISEHKANEARIHHLAHHDVLTDLPNRSLCLERLRMALEQSARAGTLVAVVFIDLDRFKDINDSEGHHVGDGLLRSVAARLLRAVRQGDTVARLGGDEFILVLSGLQDAAEAERVVAGRVVPLIAQPHAVEGMELHVSCSAGIALSPRDGHDVEHLMRNADAAMYQAKAAGRNRATFFSPAFLAEAQERLALDNALRRVLERNELELHYQPRIRASDGCVVGAEALVRWRHPEHGMVSPAKFIPIAEETGQIVPIGAWILDEACRQHAQWRAEGLGEVTVSVNVSAVQLRDATLPDRLAEALARHRVGPGAVEIELTETFLMENATATVERLARLKQIGVSLAIDDFGIGYSSLNYLHRFPIDKLKVDQSFVRDMLDDPADWAITKAIIALGHTLGLTVSAEGVEREAERERLAEAGCDELQGYLFGRPMPPAQFAQWLAGRSLATVAPVPPRPLPKPAPALEAG
jgi:diguanylate cyclase (GGDEF)-like protein/PAS domain S-box-containing protein